MYKVVPCQSQVIDLIQNFVTLCMGRYEGSIGKEVIWMAFRSILYKHSIFMYLYLLFIISI